MFRKLRERGPNSFQVTVNGMPEWAEENDTAASVVLRQSESFTRLTPISNSPRAPLCMMGVCFECLVNIDGAPNQQGCLIPTREGMVISIQCGARKPL